MFSQAPGRYRRSGVSPQGVEALSDFDVAREAGTPLKGIVKEFKGVKVSGALTLKFAAGKGKAIISGLEFIKTK